MKIPAQHTGEEVKKRESIADVFMKHFMHYGYKKTSVDEVARELSISKKTIYHLFRSKEEIFTYVVNRMAQDKLKEFSSRMDEFPTYCGKVCAMIDMMFNHKRKVQKNKGRIRDKHEKEVIVAAFRNAFYDLERSLILGGNASGEFHVKDVDMTTRYIHGVVAAGIERLEEDPSAPIEAELKEAVCRLLK